MGTTSVGAVKLDLGIEAKIEDDIKKAASKFADNIQKQVNGMSADVFKNMRATMVQSLTKTQEAIKNSFDIMKAEMKAFIDQITQIINRLNNVQMPSTKSDNENVVPQTNQKSKSIRGPPSFSIKKPKINYDVEFNDEMIQQRYYELEAMLDEYDNQILSKQSQRKKILSNFSFNMDSDAEAKLNEQVAKLDNQIRKLQDSAERVNIELKAMDRQFKSTSTAMNQNSLHSKKLNNSFATLKKNSKNLIPSKIKTDSNKLKQSFSNLTSSVGKLSKRLVSSGFKQAGNIFKSLSRKVVELSKNLLKLGSSAKKSGNNMGLGNLIKSFTIFSLIFPLVSRGISALAQNIGQTLMTNQQFSNSLNEIRSNLATAFTPIFNAIMPALNALMSGIAKVTGYISALVSALFGQSYSATKKATQGIYAAKDAMGVYGNSASEAAKQAEKAKKSLMGFDEINKLDDPTSTSSSGGASGGSMPDYTPTDVNESLVNNWVKKFKDMWAKGDYAGIGKVIGQKVNDVVSSFTKWISWSNLGNKITAFVNGFCELFNSLVDTINWEAIGKMFATGLNTIVNTIYLFAVGIDWSKVGQAFAKGVNGLVYNVDWKKLGNTIGKSLQGAINMLYGFVTTANWATIGKSLATCVTGIGSAIDWNKLTSAVILGINGVITSVRNFVENIDWKSIGRTFMSMIKTALENFDYAGLGSTINSLVIGLLDMLIEMLTTTNWGELGATFAQGISAAISSVNWGELAMKLVIALLGAMRALQSFIIGSFKEVAKWLWEGLCSGVKEFFSDPLGFLKKNIVDPIVNSVRTLFGIHSPSTVFKEIGGYLIEGLKIGMKNLIPDLITNVGEWFGGIGEKIGDTWDNVKKWSSEKWGSISSYCSNTWNNLFGNANKNFGKIESKVSTTFSNSFNKTKSSTDSMYRNATQSFTKMNTEISKNTISISNNTSKGFESARIAVSKKCNDIKTTTSSKFNEITNNVGRLKTTMNKKATETFESYRKGVASVDVNSTITSTMNKVTNTITGTTRNSSTWGSHLMQGLASGIRGSMSWVENAVSGVANLINSWLHFTRPDVGPLHYYETWMPDFMQGLSTTLEASSPNFIKRVKSVAHQMSNVMQTSLSEPSLAFAGERQLNISHEFTEKREKDKTSLSSVVEAIKDMKDAVNSVKKSIDEKEMNVNIDKKTMKDVVVDEINKDIKRTGKNPINS